MLGGDCNFLDELPPFLMVSDNYYRKAIPKERLALATLEAKPDSLTQDAIGHLQ